MKSLNATPSECGMRTHIHEYSSTHIDISKNKSVFMFYVHDQDKYWFYLIFKFRIHVHVVDTCVQSNRYRVMLPRSPQQKDWEQHIFLLYVFYIMIVIKHSPQ